MQWHQSSNLDRILGGAFFAPLISYTVGLILWNTFGVLFEQPRAILEYVELFRTNQSIIGQVMGPSEELRSGNLTIFFSFGAVIQFLAATVLGFRSCSIPSGSSSRPLHAGQKILIFALFICSVWIIFVNPPNTLNDGRLGRAAVLTDFRFAGYWAIFSIANFMFIAVFASILKWCMETIKFAKNFAR